jgi:REP element-mobilizing transposase RayT
LKNYNYGQPGAYFVTICTQGGQCLFGQVVDGCMRLSAGGDMVWRWWRKVDEKYPSVHTDAAVVMPKHFHGIIFITGQPRGAAPTGADVDGPPRGASSTSADMDGSPRGAVPTLGQIVGWFKTMTTNEYIRGVKQLGWPPFSGRVWQRNYYEHVVRNDRTLNAIRRYIADNPVRWGWDRYNRSQSDAPQASTARARI